MNAYLKRTVHIYQRPFHGKVTITIVRAPFPDFHFFFSSSRYAVASTNDYSALRSQCETLPEPETVMVRVLVEDYRIEPRERYDEHKFRSNLLLRKKISV